MKKFAFRLRRLLDIRTQQKRALAALVARLRRQLVELERDIEKTGSEWQSWRERCMGSQSVIAHEQVEILSYMEILDQRRRTMEDARQHLLEDIDMARRGFEQAARGEKTLENLRARKLEEYNRELNRMEQTAADELAMQKAWQKATRPEGGRVETTGAGT